MHLFLWNNHKNVPIRSFLSFVVPAPFSPKTHSPDTHPPTPNDIFLRLPWLCLESLGTSLHYWPSTGPSSPHGPLHLPLAEWKDLAKCLSVCALSKNSSFQLKQNGKRTPPRTHPTLLPWRLGWISTNHPPHLLKQDSKQQLICGIGSSTSVITHCNVYQGFTCFTT